MPSSGKFALSFKKLLLLGHSNSTSVEHLFCMQLGLIDPSLIPNIPYVQEPGLTPKTTPQKALLLQIWFEGYYALF